MTQAQRYDVFLSHNSDDKPLVEELALRLQDEAGLSPWLDAWQIPGGAQWETEIERALGACQACAVILGEHGWGEYHLCEAKAALARREEYPTFRVIPIFLPGAREEDTDGLPEFFTQTQWIDFRQRLDDADALTRLVAAIRGEIPYPEGRPNLSYLIRRDARRWEQTNREDESLLYRGGALQSAQGWADEHRDEVTPLALEFLLASAELEARRRKAWRRWLAAIVIGLLVAFGALNVWLAFNYYFSTLNSSTVVLRNGHPGLKLLPWFHHVAIVTDYSLQDLDDRNLVSEEQLRGLWPRRRDGYAYWGEQLFDQLHDAESGLAYWRLGETEKAFARLAQGVAAGDGDSIEVLGYLALQDETSVKAAIDLLIPALGGDEDSREAALSALAVVRDTQPSAVADQLDSLSARLATASDSEAVAVAAAVGAIGARDLASSRPVLTKLTNVLRADHDPDVQLAVARALEDILSRNPDLAPTVVPDIAELVSQRQSEMREALITILDTPSSLDQASQALALDAAAAALNDEDPATRSAAVSTLGHLLSITSSPSPDQLSALLAMANDRDSQVRSAMAEALGAFSPELATQAGALETLVTLAEEDGNPEVRYQATQSLAGLADHDSAPVVVETLVSAAGDPADRVRRSALHALAEMGTEGLAKVSRVEDALRAGLDDGSPDVRWEAAHGLLLLADQVEGGLTPALDELARALTSEDGGWVWEAEQSARRFGTGSADAAAIVATGLAPYALGDEEFGAYQVTRFLTSLAEYQSGATPQVVLALTDLLAAGEASVEADSALWTLRTQPVAGLESALAELFQRLGSASSLERETAARAIGRLSVEYQDLASQAVVELISSFADPASSVRAEIALALGLIGARQPGAIQPALDTILDCLASEEAPVVRAACGEALEYIAASETPPAEFVVPALIAALEDPNPDVRQGAARTLSNLGGKVPESTQAALEPLRALSSFEPDAKTRLAMTSALGVLGGQDLDIAAEVVAAAEAHLAGDDTALRQEAIQVLSNLGANHPASADRAIEALGPMLSDPEYDLRLQAILALSEIGRSHASSAEAALAALETALAYPERQTRHDAIVNGIEPIVRSQPTSAASAVSLLRDFLDRETSLTEDEYLTRLWAWAALTASYAALATDDPEVLWPLLTSDSSGMRAVGREALTSVVAGQPDRTVQIRDKLERLRQDPRPHVRQSAALAEEMMVIVGRTREHLDSRADAERWDEILEWLPDVGVEVARDLAREKLRQRYPEED